MKKRERFNVESVAYELVVSLEDLQDDREDTCGIIDSKFKYILVTGDNKFLGDVLYINSDLRDGLVMLVVDDCGHTNHFDNETKASTVLNTKAENNNIFVAVHSESYTNIMRISREYERDTFGMAFEIYNLRKKLAELTDGE